MGFAGVLYGDGSGLAVSRIAIANTDRHFLSAGERIGSEYVIINRLFFTGCIDVKIRRGSLSNADKRPILAIFALESIVIHIQGEPGRDVNLVRNRLTTNRIGYGQGVLPNRQQNGDRAVFIRTQIHRNALIHLHLIRRRTTSRQNRYRSFVVRIGATV